ncbi:MAG: class I SAM-dependent DNA methyltransferase [Candidatus Nanopelagicales bacterium]|nr:class I SAM-dependent DNA methyltransferase [Candidatus Nanopelagicales bacterium]MDZ4248885.1 class I SAM-dependent DNA methyltransferase [Candidatus Nanopelagicales bacterium]
MTNGEGAAAKNHAAFIWSVADLLRGDYKQSEYGKVILPLTVLRRLDCVLGPTKGRVLRAHARYGDRDKILEKAAGQQFYNTSRLDLPKLLNDPANIADNLRAYIAAFSAGARDVIDKFDFGAQISRLDRSDLLYLVVSRFCDIDLHPDKVSNVEMGYLYEELIRKFSELSNETAGEHFTPREVIRLMVSLLFAEDDDLLTKPGIVKTLFDPACGTGGMLSVAEDWLRDHNPDGRLEVFGQELNAETYAVCRSDMMLKGQDASHISFGNSFSEDGHSGMKFDYLLANPPFGVEWKKVADPIRNEKDRLGFAGRFGAGLPRINDGSFLFLQHMIHKMKATKDGGSRLAIVFNGSPLFSGAAGSGESEIRRWIIENDWLEAIVALPDQLFYNTGISTYFWIITNRKSPHRRGKIQLVDARDCFVKMRKSLGDKRKQISDEQVGDIVRLYGEFAEGVKVKILPNHAFGFMRATVERPLRLRWEITEDGIEALLADKAMNRVAPELHQPISDALRGVIGQRAEDAGGIISIVSDAVPSSWPDAKPIRDAIDHAFAIRDPDIEPITDRKGNPEPDPELRDHENIPLPAIDVAYESEVTARLASLEYRTAINDYIEAEVHPYVPDAWVDHDKPKIGYEIPFTRHFYKYVPPRPLAAIDAEIKALEAEIQRLLGEVTG